MIQKKINNAVIYLARSVIFLFLFFTMVVIGDLVPMIFIFIMIYLSVMLAVGLSTIWSLVQFISEVIEAVK